MPPVAIPAGQLDQRITIEQPSAARDAATGAPTPSWSTLVTTWASVQEQAVNDTPNPGALSLSTARPSRVRIRWRADVTAQCRIRLQDGRLLQIVSPPAMIGRRQALEMACTEWSHEQ